MNWKEKHWIDVDMPERFSAWKIQNYLNYALIDKKIKTIFKTFENRFTLFGSTNYKIKNMMLEWQNMINPSYQTCLIYLQKIYC